MEIPLVSIILPTYQNAPLLQKAIESVWAQSYTAWELLIVDNGLAASAKALVERCIVSDSRIQYIEAKSQGLQKALNMGLAHAQGKYIARIDDDDEWVDKNKLKEQISFLEEHVGYVLVGTNARIVDEHGTQLGTYSMPITDESIRSTILSKNCFLHPTIVMRMSTVQKIGGYSESLGTKHIEDYALWLELGGRGKFANLSMVAVQLTIHSTSMTYQNRIAQGKRMFLLIRRYKDVYPGFLRGRAVLMVRIIGFMVLKVIPLPQGVIYRIQKLYKNF